MEIKKILIIRFSSLGDIVLTTAFVEACKKKYPDSEIFFLTKDIYRDVYISNPNINKIYTVGKDSLFNICRVIKEENIDIVFDLHKNIRSHIVSYLIGGKIIRYKKNDMQRRILVLIKRVIGNIETVRQRYLNCLRDNDLVSIETKLYISDSEISEMKDRIGFSEEKLYVGINLGSRWNTKRWIKDKYIQLIERLASDNIKVIILGDKNDTAFSKSVIDELISKENIIDLTNALNLRDLFAIIKLCKVVLTSDSAILHIAQSLDVPVVALFGPTVKEFGFWEAKENDIVIDKALACRPCSLHGSDICPKKHFRCMQNITVDEVYDSIIKMV